MRPIRCRCSETWPRSRWRKTDAEARGRDPRGHPLCDRGDERKQDHSSRRNLIGREDPSIQVSASHAIAILFDEEGYPISEHAAEPGRQRSWNRTSRTARGRLQPRVPHRSSSRAIGSDLVSGRLGPPPAPGQLGRRGRPSTVPCSPSRHVVRFTASTLALLAVHSGFAIEEPCCAEGIRPARPADRAGSGCGGAEFAACGIHALQLRPAVLLEGAIVAVDLDQFL